MDRDNFWVRREEDSGEDRQYFSIAACPAEHECSTTSWQRVARSSFSEESLKTAVKAHLMQSGKHMCDEATADCYMAGLEITTHTESYEDRERYRKQCEVAKARSKAGGKGSKDKGGKDKGKKGKGKGSKSELDEAEECAEESWAKRQRTSEEGEWQWQEWPADWQEWPAHEPTAEPVTPEPADEVARLLCAQVMRLSKAVETGLGPVQAGEASSSQAAPPAAVTTLMAPPAEMVQVPLRQAQLLYESLTRAQQASLGCQRTCERLALQFGQEAVVIQRAQQGLKHVLLQHGGAACVPGGAEEVHWAAGT
jgi:hypothetical protein